MCFWIGPDRNDVENIESRCQQEQHEREVEVSDEYAVAIATDSSGSAGFASGCFHLVDPEQQTHRLPSNPIQGHRILDCRRGKGKRLREGSDFLSQGLSEREVMKCKPHIIYKCIHRFI